MSAQSAREQETRDRFDAWSIGERAEAERRAKGIPPLGKFGCKAVQRVRIEPITVRPVALNPALWPDLSPAASCDPLPVAGTSPQAAPDEAGTVEGRA